MKIYSDQELYNQLAFYTLGRRDPSFIHQYVVDAFRLQTADEKTKPIGVAFALISLYLFLEKGYTGRQAQLVHMKLARQKENWPRFELPENWGSVTVADVMSEPPGRRRDEAIKRWCVSVWQAFGDSHEQIENLLKERHIIS